MSPYFVKQRVNAGNRNAAIFTLRGAASLDLRQMDVLGLKRGKSARKPALILPSLAGDVKAKAALAERSIDKQDDLSALK